MSATRELILQRLRSALAGPRPLFRNGPGADLLPDIPAPVTEFHGDRTELAKRFSRALEKVEGDFSFLSRKDVAEFVARRVKQWHAEDSGNGDPSVISWAQTELPVSDLHDCLSRHGISAYAPDNLHHPERRRQAAGISVGISGVDAAIANTGSVVLLPGPGKARATTLLPRRHVALVPFSRIHPTLEAWIASMREQGILETTIRDSAQVAIVTGPSKSADIELTLTLGVHGPRHVHAVLFDDG